ncbi:MAG: helix-turn-helix transcriptional regulator [Treponema sp.]|uniref:helix-turn-helix domain-containing protein n=1 Tax=Treponema sp. TaxID=166 RepID=UPI0025CC1232|nr:helix-turn-helix transcriptional regulator [Treponema sp.]MBR0496603.1 helix-turn-helix transcriptional regulator [Treponema sp.]
MSPFWKNVDEEIKYLNMNLKTLSQISGVPYPTITNGRNRDNSIPEMETARKIADALHKPLEVLLGISIKSSDKNQDSNNLDEKSKAVYLYQKYQDIISFMEDFPAPLRESLRNTIVKFHDSYEIMKD